MNTTIRILLVEDEVFIAMALQMELKKAGYHICKSVATGEEAIVIAAQENPDVVLMDIRLAGELDGIEAAAQIRAARDIPIIFMTGYQDKKLMDRALTISPLGYFIKPVGIHDLKPSLDTLMSKTTP